MKKSIKKTNNNNREKKRNANAIENMKDENVAVWYQQVLKKSGMVESSPTIKGCCVYRPWCYSIWMTIKEHLDSQLKNVSFLYYYVIPQTIVRY